MYWYFFMFCSSCDLIGQLPLYLHGDDDQGRDHRQLNAIVTGHTLLQRAGLLQSVVQPLGHTADTIVSKLLQSLLGTLKPLVSGMEGGEGRKRLLSPSNERSAVLLLELALEIGIRVSRLV